MAMLDVWGPKKGKIRKVVGQVIVDKRLLQELEQFTWIGTPDGYAYRTLPNGGKIQSLHNYVYEKHGKGTVPRGLFLDHANQNKRDNRLRNLQVVDAIGKQANAPKHRDNTSGYKDVIAKRKGTFEATVSRDNKPRYVGTYETRIDAAHAVNYAYKKLHPEIKIRQNKLPRAALTAVRRAAIEANVDRLLRRERKPRER